MTALISVFNIYKKQDENEAKKFISAYESKIAPLIREMSVAYFNASITGDTNDFNKSAEMEIKLNKLYSNKEEFKKIKSFVESKNITDTLLKRELKLIYNDFLRKQISEKKSEEIINLSNKIEQKFTTYRTSFGDKKISDNDVNNILKNSTDNKELKDVWNASKKIGSIVADDVIKIVKLRNQAAKELGFKNYYEMELLLDEQDPAAIEKNFNELENLTHNSFIQVKDEIDTYLSAQYKISKNELMPWHYQDRFFQEAPKIYDADPDNYYIGKDIIKLANGYYNSIGLDISKILSKSDLYEKLGKNQHAYCTDIDRSGDVRVLANVKSNAYWMNTMLHEIGHGIYFEEIDKSLPYTLREPAHTFTTEAIAMMFGRLAGDPQWMFEMKLINKSEKDKMENESHKALRLQQIVFSRWAQVMYHFERSLYENPDQDLNKKWWELVEKYQFLKCPEGRNEPDWASKIHIVSSPCYYHNYLLGEILASQLYFYISNHVIIKTSTNNNQFVNHPEIGNFLKEKFFKPGRKLNWDDLIKYATGENLTAKYYAMQFIN